MVSTITAETEVVQLAGKFAGRSKEFFLNGEYVGTTYIWDDGAETTDWANGRIPDDADLSVVEIAHCSGWNTQFSANN